MIPAVTMCMPAYMFLTAISNLFGVGGASLISRSLGYSDQVTARRTSAFAVWACFAISLFYSFGVLAFIDGFTDLLGGATPAVHTEAVRYLLIVIVIGGPVTAINTLLSHLIRAEGHAMHASLGISIGGLMNIALDPLFMFVLLPRGQEVKGVALATLLSNLITLGFYAVYLIRHHKNMVFTFRPRKW